MISSSKKNQFIHRFVLFQQTTRLITDHADNIRQKIKADLKLVFEKYGGSISMDGWTDKCRKMSYFGITIHYITEVMGHLIINDRVLLIRELTAEKKSGSYLKSKILEYLSEFGLLSCLENKIVFVTDRGTNIRAAVKHYQAIPCMAHMIHNCVEEMLDKNPIVSAIAAIVKYFKASGLNAMFDQTLKSYVSTRWSSVYRMLESVIQRWEQIRDILIQRKVHLKELNSTSLEELKLLRDFLKPFASATSEIEATKNPTLDTVRPWYTALANHLQINRTDPEMIVNLKEIGYGYWMNNIGPNISLLHDVAVFLNPMLKSLKTFTNEHKTKVYDKTKEMMAAFKPAEIPNDRNERHEQPPTPPAGMSAAMAAFYNDDVEDNDGDHDRILRELEEYKNLRTGTFEPILVWWQRQKSYFPRLYGVVRFVFAIPGSSAAPERLFSTAGRLVTHRPNMRSERVDDILFLKSNADLLEKSIINNDAANSDATQDEILMQIEVNPMPIPLRNEDLIECINLVDDDILDF